MRTAEQLTALHEKVLVLMQRHVPAEHHVLFSDMQLRELAADKLECIFSERNLLLVKGFYKKGLENAVHQCAPGMALRLRSAAPQTARHAPPAFRPECSFDSFVASGVNAFACHAAQDVAQQLKQGEFRSRTLLLYGNCGVGKTHLLHAIGHEVRQLCPDRKVAYEPANAFLQSMTEVMRTKNPQEIERFRTRYRQLDVLLLDDLHFLEGKVRTQEELLLIHNYLAEEGRGVVVYASAREPKELLKLSPQLASRLRCGPMCSMTHPDRVAVRKILRRKITDSRSELCAASWPEECCDYLAETICDMRELEGCLQQIICHAQAQGDEAITLPLVKAAVGQRLSVRQPLSAKQVLQAVAKHYNVEYDDMLTKSRQPNLVYARHVAMYLCRHLLEISYPEIGSLFGGRDHSTVMHGFKRITALRTKDMGLDQVLTVFETQLSNTPGS